MNKYGEVTVSVVHPIISDSKAYPLTTRKDAASVIFSEGTWAQRKGCPKNAFLGLCDEGLYRV